MFKEKAVTLAQEFDKAVTNNEGLIEGKHRLFPRPSLARGGVTVIMHQPYERSK